MILPCVAQSASTESFAAVPAFPLESNPLKIERTPRANQPFSVTGERGTILGQQDGTFELWLLPVKMLHNARLTARLKDYDAPIDLNAHAAAMEVRPDHTTITYAHAAITVKQHMFIPHDAEAGMASAVVLFEVHAARAAEISLSFEPSMERQWPAPNFGRPGSSWVPVGSGGAYSLETDNPVFFGVVAMPGAKPGALRPYQERPLTTPLEFHFAYDPARDDHNFFPLLCAVSDGRSSGGAARSDLLRRLIAQEARVADLYRSTAEYYGHFFDTRLTVSTPDSRMDEALRWAEIAIDESRVAAANGLGLAGGWYTSGDSARPGFGWFFGRDTLWTLYAVNSYGDFALSRQAMNFLLAHQREDGKMMHEYSQTSETVDWAHLPYLYASADSTPLFVMQMEDYVRTSGDTAYLKQHWDSVKRAYAFTRAHTTDGVYDNTQGTGWVEEWLPRMPHQEIYLAALDQQSSQAMSRLAGWMGEEALANDAKRTAAEIATKLAGYRGTDGMYAFSRNADGSYETVASIFPSVAWWSGRLKLPESTATFEAWSGRRFSTDWGTRSVATDAAIYDPISYHHGSVWPLYTGWAAMAEYRAGRSLPAFAHLTANTQLTWLQDPGDITEVISGEFYEPLGRSSSHQLWSSAMVLSPAIRGLFGLEANAVTQSLRVAPQLPAGWNKATVKNVAVGEARFTVEMRRAGKVLEIEASSPQPATLCLVSDLDEADKPCTARPELHHRMSIALPAVELELLQTMVEEGSRTSQMKVLDEARSRHTLTLKVEAPAGSSHRLHVRRNGPEARILKVSGAELQGEDLLLTMPQGEGYRPATITVSWP